MVKKFYWKLKNLVNGKEISIVSFRTEKEGYLWRWSVSSERIFLKITVHRLSRIVWLIGKQACARFLLFFFPFSHINLLKKSLLGGSYGLQ